MYVHVCILDVPFEMDSFYFFSCQSKSIDVDRHLLQRVQSFDHQPAIQDFFITMAICNTVVVSQRAHSSSNWKTKSTRVYEAESPDEYALVEVSCKTWYKMLNDSKCFSSPS